MNNRRSFFSTVLAFFGGAVTAAQATPKRRFTDSFRTKNDARLSIVDISRIYDYRVKSSNIRVFCEKTQKYIGTLSDKEYIQYVNVISGYYIYLDGNQNNERKIKTNQELCLIYKIEGQDDPCTFSFKAHQDFLSKLIKTHQERESTRSHALV